MPGPSQHAVRIGAALAVVAALGLLAACGGTSGQGASVRSAAGAGAPGGASSASSASRSGSPRPVPAGWLTGARARRARVPILMYHVVTTPQPGAPNPQLYVSGPRFAAEVRALAAAGFHGVTLGQAYAAWHHGVPLPPHSIVLSFDDGYRSDFTHALPALRAAGWPGVLNLELHDVAPNNLPAKDVRRMVAAGWEVDSHTLTHPDLTRVDAVRLREELRGSRAQLRRRFGVRADFFCYPAGRFDARVAAAVRAAGYLAATTELPGVARAASPSYELPRIRIDGSDTPGQVVARVRAQLRA